MKEYRKLFGALGGKNGRLVLILRFGIRVKSEFHMWIGCDPHVIRMWSMWAELHMWKYRKLSGTPKEKSGIPHHCSMLRIQGKIWVPHAYWM